jgi:hypothetical protein
VSSRPQAAEWIRTNVKTPAGVDALVTQFNDGVDAKLAKSLDKSIDRAKTLQAGLSSAGIDISPRGAYDLDGYWQPFDYKHVLGVVVSVFFLSLGAPFWFNLLKNMTSLKSVVARQESAGDDRESVGKTQAVPLAPVTVFGINSLENPGELVRFESVPVAPSIKSLPALPARSKTARAPKPPS